MDANKEYLTLLKEVENDYMLTKSHFQNFPPEEAA
jgi:hypothetical protein